MKLEESAQTSTSTQQWLRSWLGTFSFHINLLIFMKDKTFHFFLLFYMKDEIGHSLSAIKCPLGCCFFFYSPLNQQFLCLFISRSQWPFIPLSPPWCWEAADHTSWHLGSGHLFCSDFLLTCIGMIPRGHVICLHRRGEHADSGTGGWTSSEMNL